MRKPLLVQSVLRSTKKPRASDFCVRRPTPIRGTCPPPRLAHGEEAQCGPGKPPRAPLARAPVVPPACTSHRARAPLLSSHDSMPPCDVHLRLQDAAAAGKKKAEKIGKCLDGSDGIEDIELSASDDEINKFLLKVSLRPSP